MSSFPTALHSDTLITRADDETAGASVRAERTDRQLVDLVLAGDSTAFEQIFDRHKRLVAVVSSRYFRRPEEIEEIIQISFAKAFVELENFCGRYDRSMASWLGRIASNACCDVLRSQKRKPERLNCDLSEYEAECLQQLVPDDYDVAEKAIINRDLTAKLLSGVPDDDRALLMMMYSDEMSVADIAETLGWSKSNVKIRAWRARTALRKVLSKYL